MEKYTGTVVNCERGMTNQKSGWTNWQITFENGDSEKVGFPPDVTYQPKAGDSIGLVKGHFGYMLDARDYLNDDRSGLKGAQQSSAPKQQRGSQTAPQAAPQRPMSRDDYWREKDGRDQLWQQYQNEQRDPKIEWQTYFNVVANIYIAAIPGLSTGIDSVEKVDMYIDDIYAKTSAIFTQRQKAFQK